MSNFKSSNTLRNTILAYPFPRAKRFKVRRPYYNDEMILETQKWLQSSINEVNITILTFYRTLPNKTSKALKNVN
jgi:hypothetical protein